MKFSTVVSFVIGIVAVAALIAVIMGLPVMLLWNWLMPEIFGLPTIGFWQAVGLNFLSSILFKSTSASNSS